MFTNNIITPFQFTPRLKFSLHNKCKKKGINISQSYDLKDHVINSSFLKSTKVQNKKSPQIRKRKPLETTQQSMIYQDQKVLVENKYIQLWYQGYQVVRKDHIPKYDIQYFIFFSISSIQAIIKKIQNSQTKSETNVQSNRFSQKQNDKLNSVNMVYSLSNQSINYHQSQVIQQVKTYYCALSIQN